MADRLSNSLSDAIATLNSKIKSFDKTVTIPDTGTVDIDISAETNGINPKAAIVKLGANYTLPYYSGTQRTYIEITNATVIRLNNNVSNWGTITAHVVLFF